MVGVPGRSPACGECLRRHIKCDEAKPYCKNCAKKKTKCPGYERAIIFVHFDADEEKPSATYRPPQKNGSYKSAGARLSSAAEANRKVRSPRLKQNALVRVNKPQHFLSTINTDRDHLIRLFLGAYLPKHSITQEGQNYGISWAQYLPASEHMDDTLREALHAVSCVMVGRSSNDKFLIDQSNSHYEAAIRKLRIAVNYVIEHPQIVGVADVLGATMALSNFELMRPNSGDNINKWVLHTTGAAAILEQCKISENPSPLEKALLIHVKTNCIFDAMSRRKSTFMASKEWRKKLMKVDVPDDSLRYIMVIIPTLLEKTDKTMKAHEELNETVGDSCYSLLLQCQEVDKKLESWHNRWAEAPKLYWTDPLHVPLYNPDYDLFDVDLSFPSLLVAQMMTSYWSSRALVQDTMEKILRRLQDIQIREHAVKTDSGEIRIMRPVPTILFSVEVEGQAAPISIAGCNDLAIHYASLVCRSVRFSTALDHQYMGIQAISQPLWLAQQIFRARDTMKSMWCMKVSKNIATRGLGMMERISNDFGFEDYAKSAKPVVDGPKAAAELVDVSDIDSPDLAQQLEHLQLPT